MSLGPTLQNKEHPKPNRSFVMNVFSGKLQTAELFPYPEPLNEEQKEYVQAFVDPTVKFYEASGWNYGVDQYPLVC